MIDLALNDIQLQRKLASMYEQKNTDKKTP